MWIHGYLLIYLRTFVCIYTGICPSAYLWRSPLTYPHMAASDYQAFCSVANSPYGGKSTMKGVTGATKNTKSQVLNFFNIYGLCAGVHPMSNIRYLNLLAPSINSEKCPWCQDGCVEQRKRPSAMSARQISLSLSLSIYLFICICICICILNTYE